MTQLVREPGRKGTLLDLLFVNREEFVSDIIVESCLGNSDHNMMEFPVVGEVKRGSSEQPWTSSGETLTCFEAWLTKYLRK